MHMALMKSVSPEKAQLTLAADTPFLRLPMVVLWTGLCRSTIYRMIAEERFPLPIQLGSRAVAWRRSDLDRWQQTRHEVTRPSGCEQLRQIELRR